MVGVLRESFRMLLERPAIFLPKAFSAAIGSAWFILFLENLESLAVFTATLPLLGFVSLFSSALLASAVREGSLREGVRAAVSPKTLGRIAAVSVAVLVLMLAISLPLAFGLTSAIVGGSYLHTVMGAAISILLVVLVTYKLYFVPVTVLDSGFIKTFSKSSHTSSRNSRGVGMLMAPSFVLVIIALSVEGGLQNLGYAGFILGRLLSSVVNTYLFVVSPTYYAEVSS